MISYGTSQMFWECGTNQINDYFNCDLALAETEIVIFVAFTIIKVKVRPRRSIFPKEIQSLIATDDSRVAAQFLKAI